MLIGDKYSDNRLYRGIQYYDHHPLTSRDIHESTDTLYRKSALFMNNMVGSGVLNEPKCAILPTGISLQVPLVLLLDGDIVLIHSEHTPLVSMQDIVQAQVNSGLVCIVGWYQSLGANDILRSYGGIRNPIIPNDLYNTEIGLEVSTRYQFRWDIVILDESSGSLDDISIPFMFKDASGTQDKYEVQIDATKLNDNIYVSDSPKTHVPYIESDVYIIPILKYSYDGTNVTKANTLDPIKIKGEGSPIIRSTEEPTGSYKDGTIWYNPDTLQCKFYFEGVGFLSTLSNLSLIRDRSSQTIQENRKTPVDITFTTGINMTDQDILTVVYNGVVLIEGHNYSVNYQTDTVTIHNFTTEVGDTISFEVVKLVSTDLVNNDINDMQRHYALVGNSEIKGHLKLSDTPDLFMSAEDGVAATPKAVYEATILTDAVTSRRYKLFVENGVLGIVEVM